MTQKVGTYPCRRMRGCRDEVPAVGNVAGTVRGSEVLHAYSREGGIAGFYDTLMVRPDEAH